MAKVMGWVWGWFVLMALGSLAWPTSGQGCAENLSDKGATFSTSTLGCRAYTVISNQYYIWASKDNATQIVSLVVSVPLTTGNWAGIAFSEGGAMVGSTALIATFNTSTGVLTATVYNLAGQNPTQVTPGTGLSFVDTSGASTYYDSNSKYAYMSCQLNLATSTPANPGYMLMSYGRQGTGTSLQQHGLNTHIVVSAETVTGVAPGKNILDDYNKKRKIHGSLNILGWGMMLPVGAMVARYARRFDPAWFYTHIAFQIAGYAFIIGGIVLGADVFDKTQRTDKLNAHRGLGIFLLALASLQVMAVVLRPKKDAKVRKYWNWYHHWVGRLALFLAVINIFVGFDLSKTEHNYKVGYITILAIELAAFFVLEILYWSLWNRRRSPSGERSPEGNNFQFGGNI